MTIKYYYIKTGMFGNPNNSLVNINCYLLNNNGLVGSDVAILFQVWVLLGLIL